MQNSECPEEFQEHQSQMVKTRYKLKDNEELIEYFIAPDGKRKKRILRKKFELKRLSMEEVLEISKVF